MKISEVFTRYRELHTETITLSGKAKQKWWAHSKARCLVVVLTYPPEDAVHELEEFLEISRRYHVR